MDMSTVSVWGLGLVVAYIGKRMAALWREEKEHLKAKVQELMDKFEAKTGVDIPDTIENGVIIGFDYAERWLGSAEFWRTFVRALYFKQPERMAKYKDEILALDPLKYLKEQMSPELRAEVNDFQKVKAKEIAKNYIAVQQSAKIGDVEAAIDAHAIASKEVRKLEPVTKELLEKLIKESEARQEKLRK